MKRLLFVLPLVAVLFFAESCATISLAELRPEGVNPVLLPSLEPIADLNSLETVYAIEKVTSRSDNSGTAISTTETSSTDPSQLTTRYEYGNTVKVRSTARRDPRVQDAVTIFSREVNNNICVPVGPKKGTITMRVAAGSARMRHSAFLYLSVLTFFIPPLVGLPMGHYDTQLDIDVVIADREGNVIGRYNALSRSRVPLAMYYGYDADDAERESAIRAIKEALSDIKAQIAADAPELTARLAGN